MVRKALVAAIAAASATTPMIGQADSSVSARDNGTPYIEHGVMHNDAPAEPPSVADQVSDMTKDIPVTPSVDERGVGVTFKSDF